jgi:long-chain fatty acid transport protein
MKKLVFLLLAACLLAPAGLFASSLDYLTNQSAKWFMTPTRNAATDAADIVNFNPAGTVFLPLGWNFDISNQTLLKWYGNEVASTGVPSFSFAGLNDDLKQDLPTWYLPNIYIAYNFGQMGPGKLALYGQLGVTAGGGNLEWKNGTAGTTFALTGLAGNIAQNGGISAVGATGVGGGIRSQSFKATSIYYDIAVGGAYSFLDDMLSASLGGRLLMPKRGFTLEAAYVGGGSLEAEFEYAAYGFTPIIGFDARPVHGLTLSFRYEAETNLKFEYESKTLSASSTSPAGGTALLGAVGSFLKASGIEDGKKFNQNLPHSFFLGAEYDITRELTVSLSGNMYMLSVANLGETANGQQINDFFGTGFEIGLGVTYKVIEALKLGAGVFYTETGAKDSYFNDSRNILNASANPVLDSIAFGAGGTYSFNNGLDVTLSALYCYYLPFDYSVSSSGITVDGTYKKDVLGIGIGVGYKY